MPPTCPTGYECTFVPKPVHHPFAGPWWEGPWGTVAALTAIVAVCVVLCVVLLAIKGAYEARQWRIKARLDNESAERANAANRAHELAIEEQRTMQLDACKGDKELLKMVRS